MRRLLALVLLSVIALPGCGTTFKLPNEMPPDFFIGMDSKEARDPPVDFQIKIERSGRTVWETTVRAPRRKSYSGELELVESQIVALYDLVKEAQFDTLAAEYTAEPGTKDRAENGQRIFYMQASGLDHRVDVDYMTLAAIEPLHRRLTSFIPEYAFTGQGGPSADLSPTDRFVADRSTRRFHHPGCELAAKIQPADREAFARWEDALNFKFDPCPVCKPMDSK